MADIKSAVLPLLLALSAPVAADTGETADTGAGETGDTAETADTVDTGDLQDAFSLAERTGDEGGCGALSKAALAAPGLALLVLARRRAARRR